MQFDDVLKRLRRQPFKPFRVHLTEGSVYDVRHPEMLLLGRRSAVIGLAADPAQMYYDRAVDIDLIHIVKMEEIETQPTANGQQPT